MRLGVTSISLILVAAGLLASAGAIALAPHTSAAQTATAEGAPQVLPSETLRVETARGAVKFRIMVAKTEPQRELGLMFRREMAPDQGMIFDFFTPQPVAFWMHNTILPLDIIFIDKTGRIINIAANAKPFDDTPLPSDGPARAVLEINAGMAAKLGIRPGDLVRDEAVYHR